MSSPLVPNTTAPQPDAPAERGPRFGGRLPIVVLSLLGIGQATLLLMTGSGATRIIAVVLAVVGLNARLRALWGLAALIAINLGFQVWTLPSPFPSRVAYVSIIALYSATALATAAAFIPRVRFSVALTGTFVLAGLLIAAETAIPRVVSPAVLGVTVHWIDARGNPLESTGAPNAYALMHSLYPDSPRGYFREPSITATGTDGFPPHSVTYSLNALGCRGRDYGIPNLSGQGRIVVLGGGSAFGVGVHEPDTLASRLEQALNSSSRAERDQIYEVINCGVPGFGTTDQLQFYESIASRYDPDVVLLAMSDRDNLSRSREEELGYAYDGSGSWLEELFLSLRLLQWTHHEGRRPFEYSSSADEVEKFANVCRLRGVGLAVVVFRNGEVNHRWNALVNSVSERLAPLAVPFLDVGPAILFESGGRDLAVHAIDSHPNEVAHRAAATAIERLLTAEQLVF